VRRGWIALAACFGFVAGYLIAGGITMYLSISSECDGPCFSKDDDYLGYMLVSGIGSAILCGLVARRLTR
jgi:hypothetical protein